MFLAYDGIVFDMLFLDGWQTEADLSSDGADFLRWHHIIDVTCVLNEAATAAYKFPDQQFTAADINRRRAQEFQTRLINKQNKQDKNTSTAQIPGEDVRKLIANFIRSALPFVGGGTLSTTVLPSGAVVSPPAPVPGNVPSQVPKSYDKWERTTPSARFSPPVAQQQGSTYVTEDGGDNVSKPADVSPATTTSSTSSFIQGAITGAGGTVIGGAIAGATFGDAAVAGSVAGAALGGIAGSVVAGAVSGVVSAINQITTNWWNDLKQELEQLGSAIGITKDDIFGAGRQPLPNVKFFSPPVKRNLNTPPPGASSTAGKGWTVPITYQELLNRLDKPRRQLAIWLNSGPNGSPEYMLLSPYTGFSTDALTGPVCRVMHMPAIHGNVTGILKLRFETWVAPPPQIMFGSELVKGGGFFNDKLKTPATFNDKLKTPGFNQPQFNDTLRTPNFNQQQNVTNPTAFLAGGAVGAVPNLSAQSGISFLAGAAKAGTTARAGVVINPANGGNVKPGGGIAGNKIVLLTPPLLSNRWTMKQAPDPSTHLNTTIIEGTAHFRLDVLQALQMTADQLRPFFMHPIPWGYTRMPPEVTISSDGASVMYQIVDVQSLMNNPGGVRWGIHSVKARQTMSYNSPIDFVRSPFAPPNIHGMILPALGIAAGMPKLKV